MHHTQQHATAPIDVIAPLRPSFKKVNVAVFKLCGSGCSPRGQTRARAFYKTKDESQSRALISHPGGCRLTRIFIKRARV